MIVVRDDLRSGRGNANTWSRREIEILDEVRLEMSGKYRKAAIAKKAREALMREGFERSEGAVLYKLEMIYGKDGCRREWEDEETKALLELYEKYKDYRPANRIPEIISNELSQMGIVRSPGSIRNRIHKHIKGNSRNPSREWSKEEIALVEELKDRYTSKFGVSKRLAGMISDELKRKGYNRTVSSVKAVIGTESESKSLIRPWSQSDVDLVHWFYKRGCSVKAIASDLNRRTEDVEEMLKRRPLSVTSDSTIYYKSPMSAWTLK